MRYGSGHKDATRRRIVEAASRRFREQGIEGLGVAGLMAEAGLTHGGFYAHFPSKEELVREAVAEGFAATQVRMAQVVEQGGLEALLRDYLSLKHRDKPGRGCAAAALAGEIARHPEATRAALSDRVEGVVRLIGSQLADGDEGRAAAIFSLMLGALQLARVEPDPERAKARLEAAVEAGLALAGVPREDGG